MDSRYNPVYELEIASILCCKSSSDGYLVISTVHEIKVFDTAIGEFISTFTYHNNQCHTIFITTDNTNVISIDISDILYIWEKNTGKNVLGPIQNCIKYLIHENTLIVLKNTNQLCKYNISTGSIILESTTLTLFSIPSPIPYEILKNIHKIFTINNMLILQNEHSIEIFDINTFQQICNINEQINWKSIIYKNMLINSYLSSTGRQLNLCIYNLENRELLYKNTFSNSDFIKLDEGSNLIISGYDDVDPSSILNLETFELVNIDVPLDKTFTDFNFILSYENIVVYSYVKSFIYIINWYDISSKEIVFRTNGRYYSHNDGKIAISTISTRNRKEYEIHIYDIISTNLLYTLSCKHLAINNIYTDMCIVSYMLGNIPSINVWYPFQSGLKTKAAIQS